METSSHDLSDNFLIVIKFESININSIKFVSNNFLAKLIFSHSLKDLISFEPVFTMGKLKINFLDSGFGVSVISIIML